MEQSQEYSKELLIAVRWAISATDEIESLCCFLNREFIPFDRTFRKELQQLDRMIQVLQECRIHMQPVCNKHALTSTIWPRFQKAITELDAAVDDVIPIINHIRSDCISNERIIRDTEREKELRSLRLRINVKLKVLLSDHTPREMIYSLICGKLDELESEIAPLESRHSQETADKLRSAWYFIRMNQDESKVTGARIANYLDISSDRFKKKYAPLLKQEFGIQNDNDGKGYYDPELRNLHMRYDGNDVPF